MTSGGLGIGMLELFDTDEGATIWYHPLADRIFLFHPATFLMLPCLEREDGLKIIIHDPYDVNCEQVDVPLEMIGDL